MNLYIIRKNEIQRITFDVARALQWSYDTKAEALRVNGCGMDMGFHTVHSLSYALHGNKHHDAEGNRKSGYTLNQRWF